MKRFRIGIFERETTAAEGGADTLLRTLGENVSAPLGERRVELQRIPWHEWDYRRRPVRRLASRLARALGVQIPYVDLRPDCRRWKLDAAYFPAPVFAEIDIPFVFTLWDIGHRTLPQFPEMRRGRDGAGQREALCRTMLGKAAFVVTGNEAGAEEIRRFYPIGPDRIAIIPFPNPDFSPVTAELPAWAPARAFFFYPAQFWAHKNHATLLRALALLAEKRREAPDLVLTGSDRGGAPAVQALARELGVAGRVHLPGFVSRGALKALYEHAVGLAFPSLLGPNNLPPQEAAVLGCPVVLSDLPGHRQQLADGAIYCAPLEPAAWAAAMAELLDHPARRATLAARARVAVAGFTVAAYAAKLGQLFARLEGSGKAGT